MRRVIASIIGIALVISACGDGGQNGGGDAGGGRPSSTASIEILEPAAGTTITDDMMTVRMELEDGEIVDETSRDLTPDEGHVHVKVDGKTLTQTFGLTQQIPVRGECSEVRCVEPGRHILEVEFVAKDHAGFSPRVLDSVNFEVEA